MRILTAVALLALLPATAYVAQERGHGSPSELKGLRRVYVEAGGNGVPYRGATTGSLSLDGINYRP